MEREDQNCPDSYSRPSTTRRSHMAAYKLGVVLGRILSRALRALENREDKGGSESDEAHRANLSGPAPHSRAVSAPVQRGQAGLRSYPETPPGEAPTTLTVRLRVGRRDYSGTPFPRGTVLRGTLGNGGLVRVIGVQDLVLLPNEWDLVLNDEEIRDWTIRDPKLNPNYRPDL